jgi:SAM-dependent methyltransferase
MKFEDIKYNSKIYLYCGDLSERNLRKNFIGLSLNYNDEFNIPHDLTNKIDLLNNTVDVVQSEDVMEHIEYEKLPSAIDEIYRVLKPGGLFRLSMPDYKCDVLNNRSLKDENGKFLFDPGGGGSYDKIRKKVIHGGHVWFPVYHSVRELMSKTSFDINKTEYLHYYDEDNTPVMKDINYQFGHIKRTPDNDDRVKHPRRPMSIVLDCYK